MYFLGWTGSAEHLYLLYEVRGRKKCFPKISPTFNGLLVKKEHEGFYSVKTQTEFCLTKS